MPPESSATTSNPFKGMQKFLGIGVSGGLEKRIGNNEKKITQITKILKLRKENVDQKIKESGSGEGADNKVLADRLNGIALALRGLGRVQQKSDKEQSRFRLRFWRRDREKDIEKEKEKKEQGSGGGAGRVANAIKAPFTGIFDAAKNFFGNILMGSAILGFMKWIKEMDPSKWNNILKTLQDNAKWIIGGILAIAALPILGTVGAFVLSLVGAVVIFGPIIAVIGKALAWIAVAAGAIAAIWGVVNLGKKGVKKIRQKIAGGEASLEGDIASRAELKEAGVSQNRLDKLLGRYTIHTRKMGPMGKMEGYVHSVGYDELTAQQKEAVDKHKEEIKRMNDLEKERDRKIEELNKSLWQGPEGGTWKHTEGFLKAPWNRRLTEAGKEKKKEIIKKTQLIHKSYEDKISSGGSVTPSATVGDKNITQPKIDQPLREGSTSFLPLMGGTSSPFDSSGSEGGSSVPSFASDSGKVGNQFILGVVN